MSFNPVAMRAKINKVIQYLPQCKQIFVDYAQFEDVRVVPQKLRMQFFDEKINIIACDFTKQCYKDKAIDDINEVDLITDFMEWLESGRTKFRRKKQRQDLVGAGMQQQQQKQQQPKQQQPVTTVHQKIITGQQLQPQSKQPSSSHPIHQPQPQQNHHQTHSKSPQSNQQPHQQQQSFKPTAGTNPQQRNIPSQIARTIEMFPTNTTNNPNLNIKQPIQHHHQQQHPIVIQTPPSTSKTPPFSTIVKPQPIIQHPIHYQQLHQQSPRTNSPLSHYQSRKKMLMTLSKCLEYPEQRFYFMPEMIDKTNKKY